jgi:NADH-quinone oxidoreductase subunit D
MKKMSSPYDKIVTLSNFFTHESMRLKLKITNNKVIASKFSQKPSFAQLNVLSQLSWDKGLDAIRRQANKIPYPYHYQVAYTQLLEKILSQPITFPKESIYLRTVFLELERIHCHLLSLATFGRTIGAITFYSKAMKTRKRVEEILQLLAASVNADDLFTIDGVTWKITKQLHEKITMKLFRIQEVVLGFKKQLRRRILLKSWLTDIGFIPRETIKKLSLTGPIARSAGVTLDVRKSAPYAAYSDCDFIVPISDYCDLRGEFDVRIEEMDQSINIIYQLMEQLPDKEIERQTFEQKLKARNTTMRVETPSGELFLFVLSREGDFSLKPKTFHIVPPLQINAQGLLARLTGSELDNISVILASLGEGWGFKEKLI